MMNRLCFILLILFSTISYGQFPQSGSKELDYTPDIHYYHFYNGIQMIELDYLSAYHQKINYLEQAHPRALTWEMVLGPPPSNVYLFRKNNGRIIKQYGKAKDKVKLLSVKKSLKVATRHNHWSSKFGSFLGLSRISTRYFPYYLVGSKSMASGESGNLGLIDSLGQLVLPQKYDFIWQKGRFYIFRKGAVNELRNKKLELLISTDEYQMQPTYHHNTFINITKEGKHGLMNLDGKIIVPCKYDMIEDSFNELGLAKVCEKHLWGYVDTIGREVIKCKYQSVGYFKEGLLNVRYKEKWGYINFNGKTIIPHQYQIGIMFEEGLARVAKKIDGEYYFGFIDKEGREVVPLIYSNAKDFKNGIAEVQVDRPNKILQASTIQHNKGKEKRKGKWIKIDKRGNEIN